MIFFSFFFFLAYSANLEEICGWVLVSKKVTAFPLFKNFLKDFFFSFLGEREAGKRGCKGKKHVDWMQ